MGTQETIIYQLLMRIRDFDPFLKRIIFLAENGRGYHAASKGSRASRSDQKFGPLGGPFGSNIISKKVFKGPETTPLPLKYRRSTIRISVSGVREPGCSTLRCSKLRLVLFFERGKFKQTRIFSEIKKTILLKLFILHFQILEIHVIYKISTTFLDSQRERLYFEFFSKVITRRLTPARGFLLPLAIWKEFLNPKGAPLPGTRLEM